MNSVFGKLAPLCILGVPVVASQLPAEVERACIAATVRWREFGCSVADLDGDHQADYALPTGGPGYTDRPGTISIHLSSTNAAYALSLPAGRGAQAFVLRDVNGDGYPDIALIGSLNQTVGVFLNDGSGRFEFDRLDRYLTAPSADLSRLCLARRPVHWLCAETNGGSQSAAVRGEPRAEPVRCAAITRPNIKAAGVARNSDPPRSRAP